MCRGEAPNVEQFAREHAEEIQIIGVGGQDDLDFAKEFVSSTGVSTPDMVWDPSSATWSHYGIRRNSEMILLNSDLTPATELFYGFGDGERQMVLDALPSLS